MNNQKLIEIANKLKSYGFERVVPKFITGKQIKQNLRNDPKLYYGGGRLVIDILRNEELDNIEFALQGERLEDLRLEANLNSSSKFERWLCFEDESLVCAFCDYYYSNGETSIFIVDDMDDYNAKCLYNVKLVNYQEFKTLSQIIHDNFPAI